MGLFGNKKKVETSVAEKVAQTCLLAAAADGEISDEEIGTIVGLFSQLPVFTEANVMDDDNFVKNVWNHVASVGVEAAENELTQLDETYKKLAFLSAVEVCYAVGGVGSEEQAMLESIYTKLGIDEQFADYTLEVMKIKYT